MAYTINGKRIDSAEIQQLLEGTLTNPRLEHRHNGDTDLSLAEIEEILDPSSTFNTV